MRFAQKTLCPKQNAESVRPEMIVQTFLGLPLLNQGEGVFVLIILEEAATYAALFLSYQSDQRVNRLQKLLTLFGKYVHCYGDEDYEDSFLVA